MAKITLNENLVPCERETWVYSTPNQDLTKNLVYAQEFVRAAARFFCIQRDSVRYSGFVQPGKDGLQIKVWDGEQLYRVVRFRCHTFTGVLHVVPLGQSIKACLGQDLIGDLKADSCHCGFS